MKLGDLVANRFEIVGEARSGGMGAVYKALDRGTNEFVALKVLTLENEQAAERFSREARVLAMLRHPAIVRYVARGTTITGQRYLVMEWLEGEDLEARLARAPLDAAEAITLATRIAGALALVHEQGIVHRDIKPSNLFLPEGRIDKIKLVDFGIARVRGKLHSVTAPNSLVGTPGYMAPEQVIGSHAADARTDTFALGAVLFECVTGRPAFSGVTVVELLAKILLDEVPDVRECGAEAPAEFAEVIAAMLAKDPGSRPDLSLLARTRFDAIRTEPISARGAEAAVTAGERRLLSIVFAAQRVWLADSAGYAPTGMSAAAPPVEAVSALITESGGRVEVLADGSVLAIFLGVGEPRDQIARVARCTFAMRRWLPALPIAIGTSWIEVTGRTAIGGLIEEASRSLRDDMGTAQDPNREIVTPPIRLDETTVSLLDRRFVVSGDATGLFLERELPASYDEGPKLLGRQGQCYGREPEFAALDGIFDRVVHDSKGAVALVTGEPGMGKSRLMREFVARLRERGRAVDVWLARGDIMKMRSPFGLVAELLRDMVGALDGETLEVRRRKLLARVSRYVPRSDVPRVSDFLGEVLGIAFPDELSVALRAARESPALMGDQIRRAWEDLVSAESERDPVLIVVEDLHWGDTSSVNLLEATVRTLRNRRIMVLASARSTVFERFPKLWASVGATEVSLKGLPSGAARRMVRETLGSGVTSDAVERMVGHAGGNALHLEELIRRARDAASGEPAETTYELVQARLEDLPIGPRRVLRAASVFGEAFWLDGVRRLLGAELSNDDIEAAIDECARREIISLSASSRFAAHHEYRFSHVLFRDAAYASLVERDRVAAHREAAAWLEQSGETDPAVLAQHFEHAHDGEAASVLHAKAAEEAREVSDMQSVLVHAQRAIDCGARGELRGRVHAVAASAHIHLGDLEASGAAAIEARNELQPGTRDWFEATRLAIAQTCRRGDRAATAAMTEELRATPPGPGARGSWAIACASTASMLISADHPELARRLAETLEPLAESISNEDPIAAARISVLRCFESMLRGDLVGNLHDAEKSLVVHESAGDVRGVCGTKAGLAFALLELGLHDRAEPVAREMLAEAEWLGSQIPAANARYEIGRSLAMRGSSEEARVSLARAVDAYRSMGYVRMECNARESLARTLLACGDVSGAMEHARLAVDGLAAFPTTRPIALATLAYAYRAAGRIDEALATATSAIELIRRRPVVEFGEAHVRLAYAEMLTAAGDVMGGRAALADARDRLLHRAASLTEPSYAPAFLENVPENRRTLQLARERGARGNDPR